MVQARPIDPIYSNNLRPKVKNSGTDFLNTLSMTAGYTGGVGVALAQNYGSAKTQNIVHAAVNGAAYPGTAGLSALSTPYALNNGILPGSTTTGVSGSNDMIAMAEAQHEMGQVDTARLLMIQQKVSSSATQFGVITGLVSAEKEAKQNVTRRIG